ncbi:MAG: hypothetical protein LBS19_11740 [Clostridiales bacterium]|jgi:hypothetical protein|nr:hypothetical protein [Clostridiales bacterium]
MDKRRLHLLAGFFLLLTGVLAMFKPDFSSTAPALVLCAAFLALTGLYAAKKRAALLVAGVYALYMGLAWFLAPYREGFFTSGILLGMFCAVPGASALALAFDRRAAKLLVLAIGTLWLGMFFLLSDIYIFGNDGVSLFLGCAAAGSLTYYAFDGARKGFHTAAKPPLIIAGGMGIIALLCLDSLRLLYYLGEVLPYILGVAAIGAAVMLLFKAMSKR